MFRFHSINRSGIPRASKAAPLILLLLATSLVTVSATASEASDLKVANAWITIPNEYENPSAYLIIQNHDSKARKIVGGSCKGCDWIEIHRVVYTDGMMDSEKLDEMKIPAGGAVAFVPRGLFLSLIGLTGVESSAKLPIELEFADGEKLGFEAVVGKP